MSWNDRRKSRSGRARRRPEGVALESLERRELLAYTTLGHSLPDLTVSGYAAPVASWGRPFKVTIDVHNIGSSSLIEPTHLTPDAPSDADAGPSIAEVFVSRHPSFDNTALPVQKVDVPVVPQNNDARVTKTFTLPNRPRGYPGDGGRIYVFFVANYDKRVPESDLTNNVSVPQAVNIAAPFPELVAVGLDVPPVMQPGDTIQPNIRIVNLGTADTMPQGPVTVVLVASTTPTFGPGSSIVARYTVANVPANALVPSKAQILADANLTPGINIVTLPTDPGVTTLIGPKVTLPRSPATYYLGVVVDPFNKIKQLSEIGGFRQTHNPFSLAHIVGPPIANLPPAGATPNAVLNPSALFPNPVSGIFPGTDLTLNGTNVSKTYPISFTPAIQPTHHSRLLSSTPAIQPTHHHRPRRKH